jgi:ABC-type transport system involved in cytochrome c biogenesis permease subunit
VRTGCAVLLRAALIGAVGLALGLLESGIAVILAYYAAFFVLALPWLRAGRQAARRDGALVVATGMPFVSFAAATLPPTRTARALSSRTSPRRDSWSASCCSPATTRLPSGWRTCSPASP